MYATGRVPNTEGLGLEALGVAARPQGPDRGGRLQPDRRALDLCRGRRDRPDQPDPGRDPRGACLCRHRLSAACPPRPTTSLSPRPSSPSRELGSVGLSEEAARDAASRSRFMPPRSARCRRPLPGRHDRVLMKLIVCADHPQGAGLPHRGARGGRDDPACGRRDPHGRHERGFRPDGGGASHHGGRAVSPCDTRVQESLIFAQE